MAMSLKAFCKPPSRPSKLPEARGQAGPVAYEEVCNNAGLQSLLYS